jgi:hypothetical protein
MGSKEPTPPPQHPKTANLSRTGNPPAPSVVLVQKGLTGNPPPGINATPPIQIAAGVTGKPPITIQNPTSTPAPPPKKST